MKKLSVLGKVFALMTVVVFCFQQGMAQATCSTFTTANLVNQGPFTTGAGTTPQFGSVADFNEDGFPDYAAAVFTGGKTVVFLGNGTGGFGAGLDLPGATTAVSPQFTAVGDFNEDNNVDLAVSNVNGDNISIWLGNGNGTFGARTDFPSIDALRNLVVGDFNNDNNLDLATVGSATSTNVAVHLGTGTGTFGAAQLTAIGGTGFALVVADFNEDGNADLFTGVALVGKMLIGNGTGGFTVNNVGTFSGNTEWASTGDFNNDGNVDVVIDNIGATNNVNIFLGNGMGGLTNAPGSPFTNVGAGTFGNAVGDLNGDGNLDLTVSNLTAANVTVYLGSGTGAVTSLGTLTGYTGPRGTNFADLNNDGRQDLVIIDRSGGAVTTRVNNCPVVSITTRVKFDFDGDGKADVSVFRPSEGNWYINGSTAGFSARTWGLSSDTLVPGDYDNDGKYDLAVFRPSDGNWYILRSSNNTLLGITWGVSTDTPVPGDYDGDGRTDTAVFRPSTGVWYVLNSSNAASIGVQWGQSGDIPVPGDYDGDSKTDYTVYRSAGNWYSLRSATSTVVTNLFGDPGDKPVPADYDGDGKTDLATFRPAEGRWYINSSITNTPSGTTFGTSTDTLVPADYDGDGKADIAVYRSSEGRWYLNRSTAGPLAVIFGASTDKAVPNSFIQ